MSSKKLTDANPGTPELKRCCRACCPDKLWDKLVDRPDSKPCDRCGNTTTYLGEIAFVASLPLKACGSCKTRKDCVRDNFCFRRENAERATRRQRIDTKTWIATFKVTYTTHVTVEAATEEEAREKFKGLDWVDERVDGVTDHDFDERTKIEDAS